MNTIKKGTGRPAAAAKRTKAAQTNGYAAMTLAELRKLAREAGWSSATRMGKKALIDLLTANPDGPPAVAPKVRAEVGKRQTALAMEANGKRTPNRRMYRPVTEGLSGDGASKAAMVGELLTEEGWKVTRKIGQPRVDAARGVESLLLVWTPKGGYLASESRYVRAKGGASRRVQNVASALRFARSVPAAE
jgi:hypothetical protein